MRFRQILLLVSLLSMSATGMAKQQEWRFRVFLDDKEIGRHEFVLQQQDSQQLLKSEASFEYRLLFVKLYEYQHENTETWSGNCLTNIESSTDANGEPFKVSGSLRDGQFVVQGSKGVSQLPPCSMSFAYWNPDFLKEKQLINVQNGEVLDVVVSDPQQVQIMVRGKTETAWRYALQAGEMNIELWYSENNEWLALETDARGGRRLRYELL